MVSAILEGKPDKNLILVTGRTHPKLASDVAEQLGIDILETTAYDFANGEMYVRYTESVRGADVFVLQTHADLVNKSIMEQLIMIDALKRASARSITAVCPLLGYSRQDKKHRGREPISCRLIFDLLKTAGADRIMSVDLHAAQSQGFFDGPVDHLIAMPVLVDYIRDRFSNELGNVAVVSPDAGRIRVAEQWAQRLGGGPLAFVHKTRDITRPNKAVANRVVGDVKGKDCVLVDDLIDTAGTIAGACHVLRDAGAKSVTVVANARRAVRSGRGPSQELRRQRDRAHRHGADSRREALGRPDRAVDRASARQRHPRGVRGRFRRGALRHVPRAPRAGLPVRMSFDLTKSRGMA